MKLLHWLHNFHVHPRRVGTLQRWFGDLVPAQGTLLDIGCGDGRLGYALGRSHPRLDVCGLDVTVRASTKIPVSRFDGSDLPVADSSVDCVLLSDVLHHTRDVVALLREARRVTRRHILVKDHLCDRFLARPTLTFMDWVGNARHGVPLTYEYWPEQKWRRVFRELDLEVTDWISDLRLYPPPADWVFGRSLHFVARLQLR